MRRKDKVELPANESVKLRRGRAHGRVAQVWVGTKSVAIPVTTNWFVGSETACFGQIVYNDSGERDSKGRRIFVT